MKILKHTLIPLFILTLSLQLFSQDPSIEITSSSNYLGAQPPESILDGDASSSFRLQPWATSAWLRLDFQDICYLEALEVEGFIPGEAVFYLQTEKDGKTITLPAGYLMGEREGGLLDLSLDKQLTDNLILRIEGPNLIDFRINEVKLTCRNKDEELHKKRIIPEELFYNPNQLNNHFLMVDGKIGTVWHNLKQGVNHIIYWLHRNSGTPITPESDQWALRKDLLFQITHPGPMEFLKFYLSPEARGHMTLYVMVEDAWLELDSYQLESLAGWQKVALKDLGEITRIRMALEDPSQPWNAGQYGGIGEVELWARAEADENLIQDITWPGSTGNASGALFAIPKLEESDYLLQVVCKSQEERAPAAQINGYILSNSSYRDSPGIRIWEYPVEYNYLKSTENDLSLILQENQECLSSHLIRRREGTLPLAGEDILHDGLRYSEMNLSSDPLFLELQEGEADIEEIILYFKENAPQYLSVGNDIQQIPLAPDSSEPSLLRYKEPGLLQELSLEIPGDLQEVEVLGSPNEILQPYVKILFPQAGMKLPQYVSYSYKVVGITDCPDAHIEINGQQAEISDNFFWVEMRDLDLNIPGFHKLTATAERSNGESSEHSVDVFMSSDSNKLTIDQEDRLYITWDETMVFTGKTNGNASRLTVNGEAVNSTRGVHFDYQTNLVEGLNRLVFRLESPNGQVVYQEETRRVYRQKMNPMLTILQPVQDSFIQGNSLDVRGLVSPWRLEELSINGQTTDVKGESFFSTVVLSPGQSQILVEAQYSTGIRISKTLYLQRDSQGPVISQVSPEDGFMTAENSILINVTAQDDQDLTVFVNGKAAIQNSTHFHSMAPLPREENNAIEILARDLAGNETRWPLFYIHRDSTAPEPFNVLVDPSNYTQNQRPIIQFNTTDSASGMDRYLVSVNAMEFFEQSSPYQLPFLNEGRNQVVVRALDKLGNYRDVLTEISIDTHAEAAPGDFRAVPGNQRVLLRWSDNRDDISHYLAGCEETGEEQQIDRQSELKDYEVPFEGLEANRDYRFYIQTVDLAGNIGERLHTSVETSRSQIEHHPQSESLLEYDGLEVYFPPESLDAQVDRIVMEEIEDPGSVSQSTNPVISPVYNFSVEVDGKQLDHAYFDKPFVGKIHYDKSLIPPFFPEEKLAVFYYNEDWCKWLMADENRVNTAEGTITFISDHFTEYNVQATVTDQVDYRDWDGLEFPIASESTTHSPLEVSPQNGALSTSMTEFVLPGKNGLDLEVRRTYSTTLADSDSTLLPINAISMLDVENPEEALREYLDNPEDEIKVWKDSLIREMMFKRAELAYALGQGWRLDFPYIRFADKDVMIYIPGQGMIFSGDMKKEFTGDSENRTLTRYTDSLKGRGTLEIHREMWEETAQGATFGGFNLKEIIFTENNGRKYTFNTVGLIQSISDPYGNRIDFTYTDLRLSKITDSYGREITFLEYESPDNDFFPICQSITIEGWDDETTEEVEEDAVIEYTYINADSSIIQDYLTENRIIALGNTEITFGGLPLLKSSTDIGGRTWTYDYALAYLSTSYKYEHEARDHDFNIQYHYGFYPNKTKSLYVFPLRQVQGIGIGNETVKYGTNSLSGSEEFYDITEHYKFMNSEKEIKDRTEALAVNSISIWDDSGTLKKTVSYTYTINEEEGVITQSSVNDGKKEDRYQYKELDFIIHYPVPPAHYPGNADKKLTSWQMTNYELFFLDAAGDALENPIETRKYSYGSHTEFPEKIHRTLGENQEIIDSYTYDSWGNVLESSHIEKTPQLTQTVRSYFSYNERKPYNNSRFSSPGDWAVTNITALEELGIHDRLICSYQTYGTSGETHATPPLSRVYSYNEKGNLSYSGEFTGREWAKQKYTYDSNGEIASYTNPAGLVTSFINETDNPKTTKTITSTYTLPHIADPENLSSSSVIANLNTSGTISKVQVENYVTGFLSSESIGDITTSYKYDNLGRIDTLTKPAESSSDQSTDSPVTRIDYNDSTRTVTLTDSLNHYSVFQFNNRGEIKSIQKYNLSDELIQKVEIEQDYYGNVSSVISYISQNGPTITDDTAIENTLTFGYDGLGRITSENYIDDSPGSEDTLRIIDYSYNDTDRIITITNEMGFKTLQYLDPAGRVLKTEECTIHGTVLRTRTFSYNAKGEKISESDGKGNIIQYRYDPQGNLIELINVEAKFNTNGEISIGVLKESSSYNKMGLVSTEKVYLNDILISSKSYTYNDIGQLEQESITYTNELFSGLEEDKRKITATTCYYYDKFGNMVCRKDPNEKLWISNYTTRGMVKKEISPNGGITSYDYDLKDRLKTMTDPLENQTPNTGYNGTISYHYDGLDRLIQADLPMRSGATENPGISFIYDSVGNLLSRTEPDGSITSYTYSLQNRVLSEVRSGTAAVSSNIHYEYDRLGRLTAEKPMNNSLYATNYNYDDLGRMDERTSPDGGITFFEYDLNDNLVWQKDGRGFQQNFYYDALNRMYSMTDAEGGTWTYQYHPLGQVSYTRDPNNVVRQTYYDERGSVIKETDGRELSSYYCYNANGNLDIMLDRNGTTVQYTYNEINLPTSIEYKSSSNVLEHQVEYTYDLAGDMQQGIDSPMDGGKVLYNIKTNYNGYGETTSYNPDPMGQILSQETIGYGVNHTENKTVEYSYNHINQLASIRTGNQYVSYSYNPLNQLKEITLSKETVEIDPESGESKVTATTTKTLLDSVSYNERGFMSAYEQGNGIVAARTFDECGRLDILSYTRGTRTLKNYDFDYDVSNNIIKKNGNLYGYDGKNQLNTAMLDFETAEGEEVEQSYEEALSIQQDVLGGLEMEVMNEGEEDFKLEWSARSIGVDTGYPYLISKIVLNLRDEDSMYVLNQNNLQVFTSRGNRKDGYVQSFIQNIEKDGTRIEITLVSPVMARFIKVHSLIDDRDKDNHPLSLHTAALNQTTPMTLYKMIGGGRCETYQYDDKGLRTQKVIINGGSTTLNYSYLEGTDLLASDEHWFYQYDNNGNLTGKMEVETGIEYDDMTESTLDWKYSYDRRNRLVSVQHRIDETLEEVARYIYDHNGYRIEKRNSEDVLTQYVFDQNGNMIQEETECVVTDYFFYGTTHIARKQGNELNYFSTDHLGNTSLITDAEGDTIKNVEAYPFGDQEDKSLFYTGKQWDEDAQLYYFNARWYDPETGRFITEDPIKDGLLWYGYCNNNPMGFVDPSGLEQIDYSQMGDADYRQSISESEQGRSNYYYELCRYSALQEINELVKINQEDFSIDLRSLIEEKMGLFNNKYFNDFTSQDRIPGSVESNTFGKTFEIYDSIRRNFYGAEHGGSDNIAEPGQQEYTPYFVTLVYAENNTVVYSVIGMDRFIGGKHINSSEVTRMSNMLGQTFFPGDEIHRHPAFEEGDPSYGRHEHNFEYDSKGQFYDPDTHQPPTVQPQQWRREAQKSKGLGTIPGNYIYLRGYSIPYLP